MYEVEEVETPEVVEVEETEEQEAVEGSEQAEEGLVVEIGGEEPEEEPEHITELRRKYREQQKRLKELERNQSAPVADALPPEPTLEDFDYDADAFKAAHKDWVRKSIEHERIHEEQEAMQKRAAERWEAKLSTYEEGKVRIGAPDYDEAEATVQDIFSKPFPGLKVADARMGIIMQGAKDPNTLVYALGRNPAKAKELAEIEDPVEFAFALGELSGKMRVVRGKAPAPERKISTAVPGVAGATDNTLERLREEAAKTGDYSKVAAYKRQRA